MFGLNLVKNALAKLAGSITGLASTVDQINANLRERAALDAPEPADQSAPAPAALTLTGTATDGQPATMPATASTLAQEATSAEASHGLARNGRRRHAATAAAE